jgi:hypothetical protein
MMSCDFLSPIPLMRNASISVMRFGRALFVTYGQLAEIASCPQGLVDTIGRWKNGPVYSN